MRRLVRRLPGSRTLHPKTLAALLLVLAGGVAVAGVYSAFNMGQRASTPLVALDVAPEPAEAIAPVQPQRIIEPAPVAVQPTPVVENAISDAAREAIVTRPACRDQQ